VESSGFSRFYEKAVSVKAAICSDAVKLLFVLEAQKDDAKLRRSI
jgi:hypothetical protein